MIEARRILQSRQNMLHEANVKILTCIETKPRFSVKRNFAKQMVWWTLFVTAIGWLLLVWAPMMQRENDIDAHKVLQDSQAKIDEVRSKLHDLQTQDTDASSRGESLDTLPLDGR